MSRRPKCHRQTGKIDIIQTERNPLKCELHTIFFSRLQAARSFPLSPPLSLASPVMPKRGKPKARGSAGAEGANNVHEEQALRQALRLSHTLLDEYEKVAASGGGDEAGKAPIYERSGSAARERRYCKIQEKLGFCPVSTLQILSKMQKKIRASVTQVRAKREAFISKGKVSSSPLLLECRILNLRAQELGALKKVRVGALLGSVQSEEEPHPPEEEEEEEEEASENERKPEPSAKLVLHTTCQTDSTYQKERKLLPSPPSVRTCEPPPASRGERPHRDVVPAGPSKWMLYGPPRLDDDEQKSNTKREVPPPPAFQPPPPPELGIVSCPHHVSADEIAQDSLETQMLEFPPGLQHGWGAQLQIPSDFIGPLMDNISDEGRYELLEHYWGSGVDSLKFVEAGEQLVFVARAPNNPKLFIMDRLRTGARGTIPMEIVRPLRIGCAASSPSSDWKEGSLVMLCYEWHLPPWELLTTRPGPPRAAILPAGATFILREDVKPQQTSTFVFPFPQDGEALFMPVAWLRSLTAPKLTPCG